MIWRKLTPCVLAICIPQAGAHQTSYTYDALGRLIRTSITGGASDGKTTSTEYDEAGNRKGHAAGAELPVVADAASFSVTVPVGAVAEGATADFMVSKGGSARSSLTVDYATGNGSAMSPSDYTGASGTLTFRSWETQKLIRIPIINDGVGEPAETFSIELSSASAGATIGTPSAVAQIATSAPANQSPVANLDQLSVGKCTDGQVDVLANDTDPEGNYPLSLIAVGSSTLGQAYVVGGKFGFSAGGAAGNQNVTYVVRDSLGNSTTGTVVVHVTNGLGCS